MSSSGRKTILLIGNFLSEVGRNRAVSEDLAADLEEFGWKVVLASRHFPRAKRVGDMLWTTWARRSDYEIAHVDVFSGLAFSWAEAVCCVLRWLKKPYVLTLHSGNLPTFARRWPRRTSRLLGSAAAVTVPSRYLLEQMQPYREDLYLLPNSLPISAYKFRLREHPRPSLVWLRAFHTNYNPSLAPRVVARLARDFLDVRLTMIGPDKADGSLQLTRRICEDLEVCDRVTIVPGVHKRDVPEWMNKADIFLNTTNVDNTPVSVLEAMACGLCVVSTNVGGIPYLLQHQYDALLVPRDDPESMASAVHRILTETYLSENLSRHAHQTATQFDSTPILAEWDRLLTAVAAGRALVRRGKVDVEA